MYFDQNMFSDKLKVDDAFHIGRGKSIAQYGELFQGQIEHNDCKRRCLLSLPCKALYSQVTFLPDPHSPLSVHPAHKKKTLRAVEIALSYLNASVTGGVIVVQSTVPEAKGCGSSTADCVAAVIATAGAFNHSLSEEKIGYLAVKAEIASDNIMFRNAVLFAHREGAVLEDYGRGLPALEVLGVDTDENGRVHTLEYPPATYSWRQIQAFSMLKAALGRAIRTNDLGLLGRVATASAETNQLFLPKPMFEELRDIAQSAGALGISVAHSGTVLNILLDPKDELLEQKIDTIYTRLEKLNLRNVLRFQT